MKKSIILAAALLFTLSSFAQSKGYIGISLGSSTPGGDFASTDIDNDAAGWAVGGAIFDLNFAYKLGGSNFGITALLRGQANGTDAQALADEYAQAYPGISWSVEAGNWGIGGFMIGGFGSFKVTEKTSFDPRILFGTLQATSPELKVTGTANNYSGWAKQEIADGSSFAILMGAGFKFDIAKKLYLLTNIDVLVAEPEFKNVETTDSFGGSSTDTWSQSFSTVNIGVGLGFKI